MWRKAQAQAQAQSERAAVQAASRLQQHYSSTGAPCSTCSPKHRLMATLVFQVDRPRPRSLRHQGQATQFADWVSAWTINKEQHLRRHKHRTQAAATSSHPLSPRWPRRGARTGCGVARCPALSSTICVVALSPLPLPRSLAALPPYALQWSATAWQNERSKVNQSVAQIHSANPL